MIDLEAGAAHARISAEGAEIKLWDVGGVPLIWTADPKVWPETAPILFPVVGWTKDAQVRVAGKTYPLALHGFARHRRFEIIDQSESHVRFALASDAASRALYPFDFRLIVEHRLNETSIETILQVDNIGAADMPYACGVHPGFRWPFAGGESEDYRIVFAAAEDPDVPVIAPGGLIGATTKHLPLAGHTLPLRLAMFAQDALCFLNAKSDGLRFEAPNGAAIALKVENFSHLALWCSPGHGFLCLEAWTGFSDPADFAGDLFEKPSMLILPPRGTARHAATYSYEAP